MLMFLNTMFPSTAAGLYYGGLSPPGLGCFLWPHRLPHALHWPLNHCSNRVTHRPVAVRLSWSEGRQPLGHFCYVCNHSEASVWGWKIFIPRGHSLDLHQDVNSALSWFSIQPKASDLNMVSTAVSQVSSHMEKK